MTPQQNIEQRLLSLDTNYRDFILSDYFEEICSVFADTNNLEESKSVVLENGFVLLMTFFLDRPEFVLFVEKECGIPRRDGELLVGGFIQALPPPIVKAYEEIYRESFLPPTTTNILASEILEAEAVLNTIPKPLPRPEEKVYTTTQSAILAEAKATPTAVPLPPPSSSTPRWDTERQ